MRRHILIITLALFLQSCSSKEIQLKTPEAPDQISGTGSNQGGEQAWVEKDECRLVWKGSNLSPLIDIPENLHHLPLYQKELPVAFYIDSTMPEEFVGPTHEVISEWNTEVGFEVFTIKGIYNNPDVITSQDQVDETDQKNVIYWARPDQGMFGNIGSGFLGRVMPAPLDPIEDTNFPLPFNETNVFMNAGVFAQFQEESLQAQRENLVDSLEFLQSFGIEWPLDYLQNFESFQRAKHVTVDFLQNASPERILEFHIATIEMTLESEDLDPSRSYSNHLRNQMIQRIETLRGGSSEVLEAYSSIFIQQMELVFTRLRFELLSDREKGIIYFKNVLKHEMGHTLGLINLFEDDIDMTDGNIDFALALMNLYEGNINVTDQAQMPLMWYNIEGGLDPHNPELYFDNPLEVDSYVFDALSCAYDLEALRAQAQQL